MTSYLAYHGIGKETNYSGAASAGLGDWFGTNNEGYAKQYGKVQLFRIELITTEVNWPAVPFIMEKSAVNSLSGLA